MREPLRRQARTIDVTIEYLRPGRPVTTYARADVRKIGRRIANVHVEAWQEARASPVAALRGHFMPVSYTHLDVYKRQAQAAASPLSAADTVIRTPATLSSGAPRPESI